MEGGGTLCQHSGQLNYVPVQSFRKKGEMLTIVLLAGTIWVIVQPHGSLGRLHFCLRHRHKLVLWQLVDGLLLAVPKGACR